MTNDSNDIYYTVTDNIKNLMQEKGMTYDSLADRMSEICPEEPVNGSAIWKQINKLPKTNKSKSLPITMLHRYALAFDKPIEKLFQTENNIVSDDFFTYKNLGLNPETNFMVTDDWILVHDDETIEDVLEKLYFALEPETDGRILFVCRALDGTVYFGTPEKFLTHVDGENDLSIMTPVLDENGPEVVKRIAQNASYYYVPLKTGILVEIKKGVWKIVHDLNAPAEVTGYDMKFNVE